MAVEREDDGVAGPGAVVADPDATAADPGGTAANEDEELTAKEELAEEDAAEEEADDDDDDDEEWSDSDESCTEPADTSKDVQAARELGQVPRTHNEVHEPLEPLGEMDGTVLEEHDEIERAGSVLSVVQNVVIVRGAKVRSPRATRQLRSRARSTFPSPLRAHTRAAAPPSPCGCQHRMRRPWTRTASSARRSASSAAK